MDVALLVLAGVLLAYANGANDNYKGVATLFGSRTTDYRRALMWGTLATLLGSLLALWLASDLIEHFSGKGLVPDDLAARPDFLCAVAAGAGLTVLLATGLSLPISTTHALVGGLAGAALASQTGINWSVLIGTFFLPLVLSPAVALLGTGVLYPVARWGRVRLGVGKKTCFCIGTREIETSPVLSPALALGRSHRLSASFGTTVTCQEWYAGSVLGLSASRVLDGLHYLSAGLVSFARGLNDTPKIAAILLAAPWAGPFTSTALCGLVITIGGLLSARRVAETLSHRVTSMNAGQGFTANLVTGLLVVAASRWGLPVSTTHVSCGSLFGLGAVTGLARWTWIYRILLSWLITLPTAALLAWLLQML